MTDAGFEAGAVCGRSNCKGVIERAKRDGGCSCHINPPCSYCTTPREYCPVCDWSAEDDLVVQAEGAIHLGVDGGFHVERKRRVLDPSKIDYITLMHSNSSQKCEGVYPPGTTKDEVLKRVNGTFGGRFEKFGGGKFTFIAYTD